MEDIIKDHVPGILVAVALAIIAKIINIYAGIPVMLCAVLLGISMSWLYEKANFKTGINWVSTVILRTGVVLLGLRIAFIDFQILGLVTIGLLILLVISTILLGIVLARLFKMDSQFGALTGSAVAICGASAAMAVSAILPDSKDKEHYTVIAILGMALLSTCAMITYPFIAQYLGLDIKDTGIFLGASIHDVAQVIGAGYSVSDEVGDIAILTKLLRVSTLMPVLIGFAIFCRLREKCELKTSHYRPPLFLIGFFVLMTLNSLVNIPDVITKSGTEVARYALIIAIASIGMKSNPMKIIQVGIKPFSIMVLETFWMAIGVLAIIYIT